MADDGTVTVLSPDEWKKSYLAKKGGDVRVLSPDEWAKSYKAKKTAPPDASQMTQAQAVQEFEGGGLKAPAVDPIDVLTFGAAGGALGALRSPAAAATEALKEAGTVAGAELWNQAAAPLVQRAIPGQGTGAQLARNLAQTVTGFVPFVVAGAGPQAVKGTVSKLGGAGEIAEEGVKAGEKAGETAETAQAKMAETQAKADTDLDAEYEKFRQKQIPDAKEQAKTETVQGTIGRTPEQTRAAAGAQPAEFAQRQAELRGTILEKKNEVEEEFHQEYDKTFGKYNDKPAALTVTAKKAQQLEDWAQANNITLDAPTRKLLEESKGLANPADVSAQKVTGFAPKPPTPSGGGAGDAIAFVGGRDKWDAMSLNEQDAAIRAAAKQKAATAKSSVPTTTVAQVRGLNTKWGERAGSQGPEGYVARQMRESILADLDASGVPGAKELNNRYRIFRSGAGLGDYDFLGKVSDPKGGDITNMAGEIFKNPQRSQEFTSRLNPEQKAQWREVYGDYVNNGGKVDADQLKQLGFQGPLTKPDAWVYLDKATTKLGDVFENAPIARKKFLASLEQQRGELLADNSKESVDIARKLCKKLGATGDRILAKIEAAKTPEEQAKIAYQEFGALNPAEEAQAAGVKTIQTASTPTGGLMGRLKHRAEIYGILALSGRPYFMKLAAVLGTATGIHEVLKASVMRSLRDPAAATNLYRAYIEPGAAGSMDTITRNIIMGALPAEAAQVGQAVTAKPGPMVKHVEHEKAKAIAGPRGAISPARISRIEDLNSDIAKGDAPEVQADLKQGRLTHSDVAKMVQPDKPGLANLFAGMSPQQAVDAFAVADASERELALPALAQHLNEVGKDLKPEQRQGILSQIKAVLQPQQEMA